MEHRNEDPENQPNFTEFLDESQRFEAILDHCQEKDLIHVEHHEPEHPNGKSCVIMGSSHTSKGREINPTTIEANHQLFSLMHHLEKNGITRPFYCEGWPQERTKTSDTTITIDNQTQSLFSPKIQEILAHDYKLFKIMVSIMIQRGYQPDFLEIVAYSKRGGTHTDKTMAMIRDAQLLQSYESLLISKYKLQAGKRLAMQLLSHSNQPPSHISINSEVFTIPEVFQDMCNFLTFAQKMEDINSIREQEYFDTLNDNNQLPNILWCGLSHLEPVKQKCLAAGIAVTSIVPSIEKSERIPPRDTKTAEAIRNFLLPHLS